MKNNKSHLYSLLLCLLTLVACKPDTSENNTTLNEEALEEVTELQINPSKSDTPKEKVVVKRDAEWTDTLAIDYTKPKLEKSVPITQKENLKKETKELLVKSFNAGKSCDEILKSYEAFINKIASNLDQKGIEELTKWTNDPIYNDCYNRVESFRKKADQLDELLE